MPPLRPHAFPAANRIFVDRKLPQQVFEKAAFTIPADRSIVRVFYGIGGQGKTALCQELWRRSDPAVEPSYAFLRRAELDLHGRQKDDPDLLLVWIRNGFAEAGVNLAAFDLALALMWEETRGEQPFPKLTKPWLRRVTAAGDVSLEDVALELRHWLADVPVASAVIAEVIHHVPGLGLLPRVGGWVIEKSKQAYLQRHRHELKELYRGGELKKPYELSALLPWILAQGLNHHLAANPQDRFVLFVDEYERVFDEAGAGARWTENLFDSHVRTLIRDTNGLLAVFFSRERLPWENDPDWRDDLKDTQHLLGGLATRDAEQFLSAIPIEAAEIRRAIIDGAREEPRPDAPVYPLMLDLLVEHWRTLVAKKEALTPDRFAVSAPTFEGRRREIVARVLREYGSPLQTTIERLSVARRFDRAAFRHVVETFGTGLPLDSFARIADLSFVTRGDDGFFTIHNVVAQTIRETLDPERRSTSIDALFAHYSARIKVNVPSDVTDATVAALTEAAFLRRAKGIDGYVAWLDTASDIVSEAGRYSSVAQLWRETLEDVESSLGPEHPDTATSLDHLADALHEQGDLAGARPLFEKALAIKEKALGPKHPHTATSLNNLAVLLKAQGDLAGARPLHERALAIREKALGPEHPDTASSLNNLAVLLQAQGDLAGARPLYERALAIREKGLGPEHPGKATSLGSFARLLQAQGDLAGARPLFEKALAIREKALGPEHPDTATSLNNLASLLQNQGDLAGARPLYERALAIEEKALGSDHPDTATDLNNLASLLQTQGDLDGARPLQERALMIMEKALGPDHPDTAASLNNLALLLQAQGDLAGARPLHERALAIREKALGAAHPDTATGLNNLGSLLQAQGDLAGAQPLYERALAIKEKALGPEHPDTATSLDNLAQLLRARGDFDGARPLHERALAITEKALGPEHPDMAASLNNLARLLQAQGDLAGARPLYVRALTILEKALGAEHPNMNRVRHNFARLLLASGESTEALVLCEAALGAHEKTLGENHPWTRDSARPAADALDAVDRADQAAALRARYGLSDDNR
ncbi:tetratricopeptide repeat protein [Mesorhizobium sp. AR02]|uniref:tetratricopeptide repeat protein n=1 Tax=Mesorhizobium sp. AR02 TaxID=2865837 RepID=UPI00215DDBAD|nr:tetratricopeptide repeat protein [Mesorhizobium sp. AR02]UVK56707.1 tetratricopeptide repeat protein [Mesorhizobium sp. AR02]